MYRSSLLCFTIVASMVGCSASLDTTSSSRETSRVRNEETAQLAAYAATARLPANTSFRTDLSAAAILDRGDGRVHIYNFTDKPIAAGNIWINRIYVQQFDSIPARGHITLARGRFYDNQGTSLLTTNERIQNVDLQWDRDVYSLLGPVQE